jgi:SP family sugar:H+ symporter-like MFS transporter
MYQLFITLGILIAYIVNYGTERIQSTASWRITMGIGFLWALVLGLGVLMFPESPKYAYSKGCEVEARRTMTKMLGVSEGHRIVRKELREMKEKLDAENSGDPWYKVFTGDRMAYRIFLGVALQAFQQLTGANFFFVS